MTFCSVKQKKGKITTVPSHPQLIFLRLWPGGPQQQLKGVEGNVSLLRLCLLAPTLVWEGHLSLHKSLSFIFCSCACAYLHLWDEFKSCDGQTSQWQNKSDHPFFLLIGCHKFLQTLYYWKELSHASKTSAVVVKLLFLKSAFTLEHLGHQRLNNGLNRRKILNN